MPPYAGVHTEPEAEPVFARINDRLRTIQDRVGHLNGAAVHLIGELFADGEAKGETQRGGPSPVPSGAVGISLDLLGSIDLAIDLLTARMERLQQLA